MRDFTVQRKDIEQSFSLVWKFAVSRRIVSSSSAFEDLARRLSGAGVETVLFDAAGDIHTEGTVFLVLTEEEANAVKGAVFLASPASASLEAKMLCSYVSSLDGKDAVAEMADLIMTAKGA
ncbi:MAG: hypothetical protein OXF45_00275 [Candidatus Dadabacteria bacterium]|nr:hypothetical protein [Candidatus Dadabacteria bacterium]